MTNFSLTWDYRCPFARIGHELVVTALEAGAPWDVTFKAFSLDQTHVEEGQPPVWEEPDRYPGILANLAGIVIRDKFPEQFRAAHIALFSARHDHAVDLRNRDLLIQVLDEAGIDSNVVMAEIDGGGPLETLRDEHLEAVEKYQVFGVPTYIVNDRAVFVRLMRRPNGDAEFARQTIDRLLDTVVGWPELNEFKYTSISQ